MASGAGKQATWYLPGDSQIVVFTYGWPANWAVAWDIHCSYTDSLRGSGGPSPAQMGLVLPPGAQWSDNPYDSQTYYFLVQNAGGLNGTFDLCYLYHSF
jgi:hypothetical protein